MLIKRDDGAWESTHDGPMHTWFSLSYASYLVLPRSWIQEMPIEWQSRMVAFLNELNDTLDVHDPEGGYRITPLTRGGKFARHEWGDYRHGPIPPRHAPSGERSSSASRTEPAEDGE